ncbi:MAG TPA: YceI family protein [Candidatus Methylomirabilis sp.]|nr:YceI family protein [Candidatus Methylomirabilis sp.]
MIGAVLLVLACSAWHATAWANTVLFRVQPEVSEVTFRATSRLMNADGRFQRLSGQVVVDPQDLATAKVKVSIEAGSIDTGISMRDSHLRSEDFLDVRKFPTITFESQRVEGVGQRVNVVGQLTIHGVTHEIAVPINVSVSDVALVASGELVINRRDYGIVYDSFLNPVGDDVRISFTFRARAG